MLQTDSNLRNYIIFIFIFYILSIPLPAFSVPVSMEYSLGFNDYFQIKKWTPLTVIFENRGRAISGKLEIVVTSGSEYNHNISKTTYSTDVELPYDSTRLYPFTILINSYTHGLIIRLRQGNRIVISNSINLRPFYITTGLVLVLDNKTSPDFLSVLPQSLFPVNVRPRFLPETPYGYDGVDMLILNAGILKNMRERQFQALEEWIKQGGFMVTAGEINYGSLLEKRVRRLLKVTISGHKQLYRLSSLKDFCGRSVASPYPFLVLNVEIEKSEVLGKENNIPLIIQKKSGNGKIIFLSFDYRNPPFTRWSGRKKFWSKIHSLRPKNNNRDINLDNQKILDAMLSKIPASFPNFVLTFIFIVIYISLTRFFLKMIEAGKEKRWKNFGLLFIVITIFSLAGCFLFIYPADRKNLTYNSFHHVRISGQDKIASGECIVGLYSIKDKEYRLSFGSSFYPVTHLLSRRPGIRTPNRYSVHEGNSGQSIIGYSGRWSHNFFIIDSKLEFPLSGQAVPDEQGLSIIIKNNTPYRIIDCRVYHDNRFFFIGDILPNKEQIKKIRRSDIIKKEIFDITEAEQIEQNIGKGYSLSFFKTMKRAFTMDLMLSINSKYKSKRKILYLTGWIQSAIIDKRFTASGIIGEDLTLINLEIPVQVKL